MLLLYVWQPSRQSLYCSIRAIRTRNNTGDWEQFDKKALFFLILARFQSYAFPTMEEKAGTLLPFLAAPILYLTS
jgi:hypothetical protein